MARADTILVAAASSVKFPFEEAVREFNRENPKSTVRLTFGSSGNHFAQIKNGAPFDVFFSADTGYPEKLFKVGLALPGKMMTPYARGRLAIWTSKRSQLNPLIKRIRIVLDPRVKKIAIANPRHAPYGRAAIQALKNYGIFPKVETRLALGENVAQAAQFTQSGAAQAGIVSLSMAVADSMQRLGTHWVIPAKAHNPVIQGFLTLRNGYNPKGGAAFASFIMNEHGQKILNRWGFDSPGINE